MQKKYDVYAVGNALVDIEYQVSDDFLSQWQIDKGVMTLVEAERQIGVIAELAKSPSEKACGGSAANSIMAIQRFGGQTFYSCKVANDELGDFYRQDLMGAGVDTNLSENRPDGVTGTCLVLVTPDAERTLNTYLGITETVSDTELDPQAIANAQYLYLEGYLAGSETGRMTAVIAAGIAREQGVKVALTFSDPNIVQFCRAGLEDMVGSGVDLLFCNEKEALMWADTEDLESAKAELKLFAKTVVITLGSRGAWIGHQEGEVMIQAYPVKAVDTNGAGDMFAGAFMYGITNGLSLAQAGDLASRSAAQLVTEFGPRLSQAAHQALLKEVVSGELASAEA